jgi:hypothetical protein
MFLLNGPVAPIFMAAVDQHHSSRDYFVARFAKSRYISLRKALAGLLVGGWRRKWLCTQVNHSQNL